MRGSETIQSLSVSIRDIFRVGEIDNVFIRKRLPNMLKETTRLSQSQSFQSGCYCYSCIILYFMYLEKFFHGCQVCEHDFGLNGFNFRPMYNPNLPQQNQYLLHVQLRHPWFGRRHKLLGFTYIKMLRTRFIRFALPNIDEPPSIWLKAHRVLYPVHFDSFL